MVYYYHYHACLFLYPYLCKNFAFVKNFDKGDPFHTLCKQHYSGLTTTEKCVIVPLRKVREMGRLPTGNRQYQISRVWDVHQEIMRLAVTGMKSVDIAQMLGISPAMVSYTLNSAIVQRQLDIMRAARDVDAIQVSKRIHELAPEAVEALGDLLNSEVPQIRLGAAKDVLDRAGHAAVKTLRTENLHAHFTKEEIDDIKKRAMEIGLCMQPDTIDISEVRDAVAL